MNVPLSSRPASTPGTAKPRVLAALSVFEQEHLLAAGLTSLRELAGAEVQIHSCEDLSTEAWERVIRAFRPEVLVAGWAFPALPDGYLDEPDCPVRFVCFLTGSVRRIVPRSFIERGGLVTNWGDNIGPMVAEHALLLILAALRRMPEWRPFIDSPASEQSAHPMGIATRTLFNRTVHLHGFGRIARNLIRLLAPFDVTAKAYSTGVPPSFIREHGAEPVASLEALFEGAEILVECEALTPQTKGIVNDALIARLARGAVFVNVGRGAVVQEEALARRAAAGEIHLALDVLAVEPLPLHSPLRHLPGVILSPHIAGPTQDRLPLLGARALHHIQQYLDGKTPCDLISADVYDRST